MSDRERLKAAFAELRREGFFARMNFWCCQTCATSDIFSKFQERGIPEGLQKYVYWHNQDNEAIDKYGDVDKGGMCLGYNPDLPEAALRIVEVLKKHGLGIKWDGTPQQRISVVHIDHTAIAKAAIRELGL